MKRPFRWAVFFAMTVAGLLAVVNLAPSTLSRSVSGSSSIQKTRKESLPQERRPSRKFGQNLKATLEPIAEEETENDDPDLPPGMAGKIDKEAYLRARGDYIDMLRGRDGDVPPQARENAIAEMY